MSPQRLALAWALVSVWFAAWHAGLTRMAPAADLRPIPAESPLKPPPWIFSESLLLTLLAALWFASLGHGGWFLLFLLLGLLVEGPMRRRHGAVAGDRPWLRLGLDLTRLVVAGGLLAWQL